MNGPVFYPIKQQGTFRYINLNQVVDVLDLGDQVHIFFSRGNEIVLSQEEAEPLLNYIKPY